MVTEKDKDPVQDEQKNRSNGHWYFSKKPEWERKEGLPTLKYRKGNNFNAFQQALYRRALRDYRVLAKLIKLNKYYEPTLDLLDFSGLGLSSAEQAIMRQEALKEHSKLIARMKLNRPKLYGLILEHMSVESKDEVTQDADYETWHKATDTLFRARQAKYTSSQFVKTSAQTIVIRRNPCDLPFKPTLIPTNF
jgi:hypothetical protein